MQHISGGEGSKAGGKTGADRSEPAVSRRRFLSATVAVSAGGIASSDVLGAALAASDAQLAVAAGDAQLVLTAEAGATTEMEYLTPPDGFTEFEREKPHVSELPAQRLRDVGLDRETWRLEVVPDPESDSRLEKPMSLERGSALDWHALLDLAERHSVRFLHVLSCTNMDEPLGMGLWEGVPLRTVLWLARPVSNIRRVYYHGYHNGDPAQRFDSSLTLSRVLEEPPGELPVILCYKLNGRWLSPKAGGPVRLVVPGAYGNKWVKWLQRIVLTNDFRANDTYARWNNDVESPVKTCARFVRPPATGRAGQPLSVGGLAQVGMSGLSRVQCSLVPVTDPLPADDPHLERLEWRDARILPPPTRWGGGLPEGKLPPVPLQFDPATGAPRAWPLRYTLAHWTATVVAPSPGSYHLRCRAVDSNGIAQPLPRPLPRSGNNRIQEVTVAVEG